MPWLIFCARLPVCTRTPEKSVPKTTHGGQGILRQGLAAALAVIELGGELGRGCSRTYPVSPHDLRAEEWGFGFGR